MEEREKIIRKVAFVSKLNGTSIAFVAGLGALFSLAFQDWLYALLGLAIAASGVMELKGRKLLLESRDGAEKWLKGSQLWLMALIIAYAGFKMLSFDTSDPLKDLPTDIVEQLELTLGMNHYEFGQYITLLNYSVYGIIITVTIFYQGGMWLYYKLKTSKLTKLDQQIALDTL